MVCLLQFIFRRKLLLTTLVLILISSEPFLYSIDSAEVEYQLDISKAQIWLEKGDVVQAGKIVKNLQKKKVRKADVYKLLGDIHFKSSLYKAALEYYEKADQVYKTFIFEDDYYKTLWRKVRCFQILNKPRSAIKVINRILDLSYKPDKKVDRNRGRALFYQAITFRSLQIYGGQYEFLPQAIQNNFFKSSAYLLLLYYFATFTQEEINFHFSAYFPRGTDVPLKENIFLHYYKNWKEDAPTTRRGEIREEMNFFAKNKKPYNLPDYNEIIQTVEAYKAELNKPR